jgi:hypothetical protein
VPLPSGRARHLIDCCALRSAQHRDYPAPRLQCPLAFPDCFTRLGGNQYINSASMGAWEDFLLHEMLPAIEQRFGCGGTGRRRRRVGLDAAPPLGRPGRVIIAKPGDLNPYRVRQISAENDGSGLPQLRAGAEEGETDARPTTAPGMLIRLALERAIRE